MKGACLIPALLAVLLLSSPASAYVLDHHECYRGTDEATLVETAREILHVNAANWEEIIYYWADDAVYKETVITNTSRQAMADYLELIFAWSSDMELIIKDEIWGYDAHGDFVFTATNVWSGTWEGFGPYVQEGMSIVKFRPGEGCAYYQRDYFTEGDTWLGIPQLSALIAQFREEYLKIVQKDDECFDEDGDGYSKYLTTGCTYTGVRDCNDYDPEINPGAEEILGNGLDDNCNGKVDEAAVCGTSPVKPETAVAVLPVFALFLLPAGFVFVFRRTLAKRDRDG